MINTKKSRFDRHRNFIKEISIIKFKAINQYKFNIYSNFLTNFGYVATLFLSFHILKSNFSNLFYWNMYEYLFFFLLLETGLFIFTPWFRYLYRYLLTGEFNNCLLRPINPFINYTFSSNKYFDFINAIFYIMLLIIYIFFILPNLNILKFTITFIFFIIGGVMNTSTYCLIDSLGFFMKNNRQIKSTYFKASDVASRYPASFFKNSNIFYIIIFLANTYFAIWTTDFYFSYINFQELIILFIPCFIVIFISIISSILLWKFGIEKYEAFG